VVAPAAAVPVGSVCITTIHRRCLATPPIRRRLGRYAQRTNINLTTPLARPASLIEERVSPLAGSFAQAWLRRPASGRTFPSASRVPYYQKATVMPSAPSRCRPTRNRSSLLANRCGHRPMNTPRALLTSSCVTRAGIPASCLTAMPTAAAASSTWRCSPGTGQVHRALQPGFVRAVRSIFNAYQEDPEGECRFPTVPVNFGKQ
jgi:hypothetical protein